MPFTGSDIGQLQLVAADRQLSTPHRFTHYHCCNLRPNNRRRPRNPLQPRPRHAAPWRIRSFFICKVHLWERFYGLRTLPTLPFLDPAVFDAIYGKSEMMGEISMFFFDFRPRLSPDGRYVLVSGLASYPKYGVEGTGTWIDLADGARRPDGVIAKWAVAASYSPIVGPLCPLSKRSTRKPPEFGDVQFWDGAPSWAPRPILWALRVFPGGAPAPPFPWRLLAARRPTTALEQRWNEYHHAGRRGSGPHRRRFRPRVP